MALPATSPATSIPALTTPRNATRPTDPTRKTTSSGSMRGVPKPGSDDRDRVAVEVTGPGVALDDALGSR